MKVTLHSNVGPIRILIPDRAPTPRVIFDRVLRQCFVLDKDYEYSPVPFFIQDSSGSMLYEADGSYENE